MTATDRLHDDYPHGTRLGYEKGCRGRCPAGDEHGLSCKRAKVLDAGDYQYQKLFRRGATPAEIAEHLGLVPDTHGTSLVTSGKTAFTTEDDLIVNQEADEAAAEKPAKKPDGFETYTKHHARTELPEGVSRAQVRAWARENGIEVNDRGALPKAVIEAYTTRHDTPTVEPETVEEDSDEWEVIDVEIIPDPEDTGTTIEVGRVDIAGELHVHGAPIGDGLLDALTQLISLGADPATWVHRAVILAAANVTDELVDWLADVASHGTLTVEDTAALAALGIPVQQPEHGALGFVLRKWADEQHRAEVATIELERAERTLRIDDQEMERLLGESTRLHQEVRALRAQLDQKRPRRRGRAA